MGGVSKGMLPVKHPAPKILKITAVNHCGRQMPAIERKVQPRILEGTSLACSMEGGLMSALGCGLGHGT